jgi:RNA polymerase sigma-70 factor (ECF subfamily)
MDTACNYHQGQAAPKREQIFSQLYSKSYETLHSFLINIVHEKAIAEDLAHNVFLKLCLSMDKFQIDNYEAYLYMMARNEAITHLRRMKQVRTANKLLMSNYVEGVNFTEEVLQQKETEVLFQKAIDQLSPQRRKVYVLGQLERLPREQIAKLLGISPFTVKEIMRTSTQQIREFINLHLDDNKRQMKQKAKKHQLSQVQTLKAA